MRLLRRRIDPTGLELDPVRSAGIDDEDLSVEIQQAVQGRIAIGRCPEIITY
jgi:hypothetical protein